MDPSYRFSGDETRQYWKSLHLRSSDLGKSRTGDELEAVCYPGASARFNQYIEGLQRTALLRGLSYCKSSLNGDILELGCGSGRWIPTLKSNGARVTGIDISEHAIAKARLLNPDVDFLCADVTEYNFSPASYDLVVSITVLQHLPYAEQLQVLAEIARTLRPSGRLLLMENTRDVGGHVFGRSLGNWMDSLENAELKPALVEGYQYDWPLRLGQRILGKRRHHLRRLRKTDEFLNDRCQESTELRYLKDACLGFGIKLNKLTETIGARVMKPSLGRHCLIVASLASRRRGIDFQLECQ